MSCSKTGVKGGEMEPRLSGEPEAFDGSSESSAGGAASPGEGKRGVRRRVSGSARWRFAALAAVLVGGLALVSLTPLRDYLTKEWMGSFIGDVREAWWSPWMLVALYVALAVSGIPTGPLLVGGAVFGFFPGAAYNLLGLLLGAAGSYYAARWLGRDFVVQVSGERLRRAERLFEQYGFWPLVQTRFLPLPFSVVNFGAALAGVKPSRFFAASVLGLAPTTLAHTYFIARWFASEGSARVTTLVWYAGFFVVFNILLSGLWLRRTKANARTRPADLPAEPLGRGGAFGAE